MFEKKYKNLLINILGSSNYRPNRTNINTYSVFGGMLSHNINDGFPILTSKKIFKKNFIHELIWFLKGDTNIKYLKDNGVKIWDEWADENGNLGPVYGSQLRNFNNKKDQLLELIENIKNDPFSRRHLITLWDPTKLNEMALPPCYFAFQFYVIDKKLNINVFMRSCDAFIGLPYDFALFACLLEVISKEVNLKANEIKFNFTDLHIYENHIPQIIKYLNNPEHLLPKMTYIGNLASLSENDFTFIDYKSEGFIKTDVAK